MFSKKDIKTKISRVLFVIFGVGVTFFGQVCLARPLNPGPDPLPNETELDRSFRLAINAAIDARFNDAIVHYQKAAQLATDPCDKKHAEAGITAATYEKPIYARLGDDGLTTQGFASYLSQLTESLPCVSIDTGTYH